MHHSGHTIAINHCFYWMMWTALDLAGCGNGGEGEIRTPGTLASTSDFESGAFNQALPPLRIVFNYLAEY
jgi:hypothetical protein